MLCCVLQGPAIVDTHAVVVVSAILTTRTMTSINVGASKVLLETPANTVGIKIYLSVCLPFYLSLV